DVERFKPGQRPGKFRAVFSGALIKRKGIHHVLEAWHRLNLPHAELWLVGSVHDEAKPFLKQFWRDNIRVVGFVRDPETYLNQSLHSLSSPFPVPVMNPPFICDSFNFLLLPLNRTVNLNLPTPPFASLGKNFPRTTIPLFFSCKCPHLLPRRQQHL